MFQAFGTLLLTVLIFELAFGATGLVFTKLTSNAPLSTAMAAVLGSSSTLLAQWAFVNSDIVEYGFAKSVIVLLYVSGALFAISAFLLRKAIKERKVWRDARSVKDEHPVPSEEHHQSQSSATARSKRPNRQTRHNAEASASAMISDMPTFIKERMACPSETMEESSSDATGKEQGATLEPTQSVIRTD